MEFWRCLVAVRLKDGVSKVPVSFQTSRGMLTDRHAQFQQTLLFQQDIHAPHKPIVDEGPAATTTAHTHTP